MMNRRHAARRAAGYTLLGLPALLSACAATSVADGAAVGPNDGLLVVQLSGNVYGSLGYERWGDQSMGAMMAENLLGSKTSVAFGPPEDTLVLPLATGEYMWTRMSLLNQHVGRLQKSSRFKISRGAITYIGALRVNVASDNKQALVQVTDREAEAKALLGKRYPKYLASMPFQKTLAELQVSA